MNIFDEHGNKIESPDLVKGYLEHVSDSDAIYHEYPPEVIKQIDRENEEAENKHSDAERIAHLEAALTAIGEGIASV